MNTALYDPNYLEGKIFQGSLTRERITRLNADNAPSHIRTGLRSPYPSPGVMVSWCFLSQSEHYDRRFAMSGITLTDHLWMDTIVAHRLLTERSKESLIMAPETINLFSRGLYNPDFNYDTPPQWLTHTFRYSTSLSAHILSLVDIISANFVRYHNGLVADLEDTNKAVREQLQFIQQQVSNSLRYIHLAWVNGDELTPLTGAKPTSEREL